MKRVLVPLANGFEEVEALTPVDMLRRGGVSVTTAALAGTCATGSHDITVMCDASLDDVLDQHWDLVFLPGGMPGAKNLREDPRIQALVVKAARDAQVAAICAAPMVLGAAGLLDGKKATSFPGFLAEFPQVTYEDVPYITDGNISTGRGPGVALDFALHLLELLEGRETRTRIEAALQRPATHLTTPQAG